jgi:hypothetical protein
MSLVYEQNIMDTAEETGERIRIYGIKELVLKAMGQ